MPNQMATGLVEVLHQSMERTAEAQKIVLDHALTQQTVMIDATRRQMGVSERTPDMAESIRDGMHRLLDNQKRFLDVAAEQGEAMFEAARRNTTSAFRAAQEGNR